MVSSPRDAVRRVLIAAGITGTALTLAAGPALAGNGNSDSTTSGHNPPGNNGTVKIHEAGADPSPDNEPHVSCSFFVSFYGFDAGQTMDVSFTGQAPTGKDEPIAITDPALRSKTSTTDAGGAGNDYDGDLGPYNASNLDLSRLGAPANQGYHIKLDVSTGEPGGHKYKVFWFSPCTSGGGGGTTGGTSGTTTGSESTGGTSTGGTTGGTTGSESTGGTSTGGTSGTTTGSESTGGTSTGGTSTGGTSTGGTSTGGTTGGTTSGTTGGTTGATTTGVLGEQTGTPAGPAVLGEKVTRTTPTAVLGTSETLPFTGTDAGLLAALGAATLGGGVVLTVAGRRRRAAKSEV
jgi:hypothetical protein